MSAEKSRALAARNVASTRASIASAARTPATPVRSNVKQHPWHKFDFMNATLSPVQQEFDVAAIMGGIYGDGIIGRKGAFSREWVQHLDGEIKRLYPEALARPGGAVGRGPKRHYVEIHPEDIQGFVDLITHPWVVAVCEAVLGPEYSIVEIGFDVPNPGAVDQPWHRDFPAPEETLIGR